MLTPTVRRTFAPRGRTPIHYSWDRRDRISAISAITISPNRHRLGLYFHLLPDNENVHAKDVVCFMGMLWRQLQRPLTVIWDGSRVHDRAKAVQTFLRTHRRIVTEKLPAYAPDLNPDEGAWGHTKYARLCNFAPTDTNHLRERLTEQLDELRHCPDLLAAFVKHTKLPIRL